MHVESGEISHCFLAEECKYFSFDVKTLGVQKMFIFLTYIIDVDSVK